MIPDPNGRGFSRRRLGLAGVTTTLAAAAVVYLLGLRYLGAFDDNVAVTAVLTSTGDGLPARADVKFRGLLVGSVTASEIAAGGERQHVRIELEPDAAARIPATVRARVVPSNIFGVTALELLDSGPGPRGLRTGAMIGEDTSTATTALQTTLTTLRTVLHRIDPEKLGRVLGTLADALDPAARLPGSTIERLNRWATEMRAIPEIGTLLGDLGNAATQVASSAPELIEVLGRSVTVAHTVTERRAAVVALLSGSGTALDATNALFARNPDAGKHLVTGLDETFGALADDPEAIAVAVANLNDALGKLGTVFHWGPARQMVWSIDLSFSPFRQYTAADCPRYAELPGPRCGGVTVPEVAPAQEIPKQLVPGWLPGTAMPQIGLPVIPLLPAPSPVDPSVQPAAAPIALRGVDAIAAVVGGRPTMAHLLLLGPVLAGGALTPQPTNPGER
ncbi:MCE family protein [Nocardia sp. NPDC050712]|uniref:MlaD family protein n=1 Tax=Nocardia sp. NPDC050712 TaxID=3155518 RepID=UPI0033EF5DA8